MNVSHPDQRLFQDTPAPVTTPWGHRDMNCEALAPGIWSVTGGSGGARGEIWLGEALHAALGEVLSALPANSPGGGDAAVTDTDGEDIE